MSKTEHRAIFINNDSNRREFIKSLMAGDEEVSIAFKHLQGMKGALYSKLSLDVFVEEEARHDIKMLSAHTKQSLQSFSSGERKKALLAHLLKTRPDYLVLDNPFDNLDKSSVIELRQALDELAEYISMVQLISRKADLLHFIDHFSVLVGDTPRLCRDLEEVNLLLAEPAKDIKRPIPPPLDIIPYELDYLVELHKVSVSYGSKAVLNNVNWQIKPGDFWELSGKNGSGKTTLLSMITGDNPKGYGQNLYLFGKKKGSGESIWEIKRNIGYFTPAMVDRFRGYHSLENMLISGIMDSVGLYVIPSEAQKRLALQWLTLVGLENKKDTYFHHLSLGQQRLIMCIRAMIKHPPLLILDEPTAGLDDESADLVVDLVNKMASESRTAIIFVSHRDETNLDARQIFKLEMSQHGSYGQINK